MLNFEFHPTTKVLFGKETEKEVGVEVARHGKKALLHYGGGSIKKSGLYERVIASLKSANVEVVELGGVQPNPRITLVREGIELCRAEGVDFVLAVGGGSVIDSAKAIAFGVPSSADVWDEFFINQAPVVEALPVGTILTLPAAGSEASPHTVISDEVNERKLAAHGAGMLPVFSILNPELTQTLPAYQTACGASDMLAHTMERYFTNTEDVNLTDELCEGTMRSILLNGPKVLAEPDHYGYRAELMLAGMIAHNDVLGLGREGDWMTHDMEHELSAIWDVTHGEGLSILFPAWITYVYKNNVPRFVRFAEKVFGITDGDDEQKVLAAVEAMRAWYKALGLATTLSELKCFEAEKINLMAERCIASDPRGGLAKLSKSDVAAIYRLAL